MQQKMEHCKRSRGVALARAGAVVLAAVAGLLGLASSGHQPAGSRAGRIFAAPEQPQGQPASELIDQGDAAWRAGQLDWADRLYRRALDDDQTRARASTSLQKLYRDTRFRLTADEAAIAETRRLLGESFVRFETSHFVILSDCSADWTRTRGELLEATRQAFFRVADKMGVPAAPHQIKLVCVLFNDHQRFREFARANDGLGAGWVAGYYATRSNRVVFYNDATSPMTAAAREQLKTYEEQLRDTQARADRADRDREAALAQRLHASAEDINRQITQQRQQLGRHTTACSTAKTIHEAVHLLAFNTGVQLRDRDYPFWLSEGLATGFETDNATNAFGPDRSPGTDLRLEKFRQMCRAGKLLPLQELVELGEVPAWDGETADTMYSLGHALFGCLFRADPKAMGAYMMDLNAEPAGPISRERQVELFTRHFGDLNSVQKRLINMGRASY
jgi:hypothetical protein